jgi:hypothetical protein
MHIERSACIINIATPQSLGASKARVSGHPAATVTHRHGIRTRRERSARQYARRAEAAPDPARFGPPFHLQAVWAIILEIRDFPVLVQPGVQFAAFL